MTHFGRAAKKETGRKPVPILGASPRAQPHMAIIRIETQHARSRCMTAKTGRL
jgi:hypothetical protein